MTLLQLGTCHILKLYGDEMRIGGYEVPGWIETACLDRMQDGIFRASDIAKVALDAGAPVTKVDRVADRLIQREKKAKNIVALHYPFWGWIDRSWSGWWKNDYQKRC